MMSLRAVTVQHLLLGAALVALVVATTGCEDSPYCFANCEDTTTASTTTTDTGGGGGSGGCMFNCGGNTSGVGGGGACQPTNGGIEACDGIDNDCDDSIDEDFDMYSIKTCGTCDNDCLLELLNADPASITCTWDGTEGQPGTCDFTECATGYFDLDPNVPGCEYYCGTQTAQDDTDCNNKDDDCDGEKDEDVDLCNDVNNCGACGATCVVVNGTGTCTNQNQTPCTPANTECAILECDDLDNDTLPDFHDLDGSYATGCEYQCEITNNGDEICGDGIDNDCDGAIDGVDTDLSADPQIGVTCYGDPDGWCADPANAGVTACVGQTVVCTGPNVKIENQVAETCNNIDDDCDGVVDDNPGDAGNACGQSNVAPCSLGTEQCQNGVLVCVGNIDPGTEVCNGIDDDCDTQTDEGYVPSPCEPPGNPPGLVYTAPSVCTYGQMNCVAGVETCQGGTGPSSTTDTCGVDANCDGSLDNQPDLNNDPQNCGACGNDCMAGSVNALWVCNGSGTCVFDSCLPGYHSIQPPADTCEYPCLATGSEVCDNLDNDCNGQTDEGLTTPAPTEVCGVAPAATAPECTSGVNVVCSGGSWQCTFPPGVCNPTCATPNIEICDALDNDCDGSLNENVPDYGLPCASDDGLPYPGHGACQTTGIKICNGPSATQCSAVKESCANLPNGCTEHCDGIDNDCDTLVDEDKWTNSGDSYFVRPAVIQITSNRWMFAYEASRPNASPSSAGTGNGYHCDYNNCGSLPNTPQGTPPDATLACSAQGNLPWFNVNPVEVEQTCDAIGGFICTLSEWQTACEADNSCDWGYNPSPGGCQSLATGSKYCNLHAFDFDGGTAGIQDGLLVTGSPSLQNCWADWLGTLGNTDPGIYDITGNLREITKNGSNVYPLMGGAFNSPVEYGATCGFDFYVVDMSFALLDTGFRCCFSSDPT